jgi:(p)ppGpp synthase/HD superfamily hydrolase
MIDSAIAFAATAHAGQKRKYVGTPYIVHPIEVMTIVHSVTQDEAVLAAAVLHDVLEDTPVGQYALLKRFGQRVLDLVIELTEVEVPGNRTVRKAAEAARLAGVSPDAQTIKLADLISNTATIVELAPGFARVYLAEKKVLLDVMVSGDPTLREQAIQTLNDGLQRLELRASP